MNVNQLKQSNFLTRHEVGKGMLVTIKGDVFQENVAKSGAPEELRYCLQFEGVEKPMVLNSTNGQIIAAITGSEESSHWAGHKIVLFDDPTVSFGGKLVGGIRVRAPRIQVPKQAGPNPAFGILGKAKSVAQTPPTPEVDPIDEIPF